MGIEIRNLEVDSRMLSCPVVVCDQCREVITDARWALYQWRVIGDIIEDGSLAFLHKIDCRAAWEETHEGAGYWHNMELSYFPLYLGNNLGIDWDDAQSRAERLSLI